MEPSYNIIKNNTVQSVNYLNSEPLQSKENIAKKNICSCFPKSIITPFANFRTFVAKKIYAYIPALILSLIVSNPVQAASEKTADEIVISKIQSIKEMPVDHPKDTLVFFDLDDTAFDSSYMLASKSWRAYIRQATKDTDYNWHDIFSLFLARKLQLTTVEPEILQILEKLKANECVTSGLTARERQKWYDTPVEGIDELTLSQLRSVNINFDDEAFKNKYPQLAKDSEYYDGVFFCDTDLKGDYLKRVIEASTEKPIKIVFIDDKKSQVESVAKTLKQLQIPHECYWYCATDVKASKFNPLIANIQLYYFWMSDGQDILSDEQAEEIAKQNPEKNAEDYLKAIIG